MSEELDTLSNPVLAKVMTAASLEDIESFERDVEAAGVNLKDQMNDDGMKDHLIEGMYGRALKLPKGMFLTGMIHARDYIDIFVSGHVTVKSFLDTGEIEEAVELKEFQFLPGKAGRKRVLYVHEDTLWITVDPTIATAIADVAGDVIFPKMDQYKNRIEESV